LREGQRERGVGGGAGGERDRVCAPPPAPYPSRARNRLCVSALQRPTAAQNNPSPTRALSRARSLSPSLRWRNRLSSPGHADRSEAGTCRNVSYGSTKNLKSQRPIAFTTGHAGRSEQGRVAMFPTAQKQKSAHCSIYYIISRRSRECF
jgi:hypothetical protein